MYLRLLPPKHLRTWNGERGNKKRSSVSTAMHEKQGERREGIPRLVGDVEIRAKMSQNDPKMTPK